MPPDEKRRPAAEPGGVKKVSATNDIVTTKSDYGLGPAPRAVYGTRPVKRIRRTRAALAEVDAAIVAAVEQEHPVSLRGVYYRVVSAGVVDKTEAGYKLISRQLVKLRADGVVPYSHITDGTRLMRKPRSWSHIDEMLENAARSYRRALWADQDVEIIVLSEKDAISGAVYPVTSRWDVELGICRGYASVTFLHSIAETVRFNTMAAKSTVIYNLGDHDPSGVDAWRALQDSVKGFVPDGVVEFARLAVTEEQIADLRLPTRPTKTTDTRSSSFVGESVEVDAIQPTVLREIVENAITSHIDPEAYRLTKIAERSERDILTQMTGGAR